MTKKLIQFDVARHDHNNLIDQLNMQIKWTEDLQRHVMSEIPNELLASLLPALGEEFEKCVQNGQLRTRGHMLLVSIFVDRRPEVLATIVGLAMKEGYEAVATASSARVVGGGRRWGISL